MVLVGIGLQRITFLSILHERLYINIAWIHIKGLILNCIGPIYLYWSDADGQLFN